MAGGNAALDVRAMPMQQAAHALQVAFAAGSASASCGACAWAVSAAQACSCA